MATDSAALEDVVDGAWTLAGVGGDALRAATAADAPVMDALLAAVAAHTGRATGWAGWTATGRCTAGQDERVGAGDAGIDARTGGARHRAVAAGAGVATVACSKGLARVIPLASVAAVAAGHRAGGGIEVDPAAAQRKHDEDGEPHACVLNVSQFAAAESRIQWPRAPRSDTDPHAPGSRIAGGIDGLVFADRGVYACAGVQLLHPEHA